MYNIIIRIYYIRNTQIELDNCTNCLLHFSYNTVVLELFVIPSLLLLTYKFLYLFITLLAVHRNRFLDRTFP